MQPEWAHEMRNTCAEMNRIPPGKYFVMATIAIAASTAATGDSSIVTPSWAGLFDLLVGGSEKR